MEKSEITVSIIIPIYNVSAYIEQCIRSVMYQTYTGSLECLIVDDCGSDNSIATVERMIAAYEGPIQFQILHHEQNRGLSAARNTGTMQARGTYLYYLDSDDEMTADCIETLMGKMVAHPELEMVQGNTLWHYLPNRDIIKIKQISLPLSVTNEDVRRCFYQYKQMSVNVWNKLIRREFIIHNNIHCQEGVIFEDLLWSFNLVKVLQKAALVSGVTYHHKIRPQSITTGIDNRSRGINFRKVYYEILTHLTPGHEQEEIDYYVKRIVPDYFKYGYNVPEFRDVINLCREQSKRYCAFGSRLRLEIIYFLGKSKYGWVIWASARKVKHLVKLGNNYN